MSTTTPTASPGPAASPGLLTSSPGPAALPDPAWWAPGLALHERGDRPSGGDVQSDPAFAARLADLGLPPDPVLAETAAQLADRVDRPGWARLAEEVVCASRPLAPDAPPVVDWRAAFGRVLEPLVTAAVTRLRRHDGEHVNLATVGDNLATALAPRLLAIAVRTLVTELHRWRDEGRLTGTDGPARFQDFTRRLTAPAGLGEVFTRYPVLARLLAQVTATTAEAAGELLDRFARDRETLVETLLGGVDPGPVTGLLPGRGDHHGGGRSVTFVDFADGRRIVYKPRDLGPHVWFAGLLGRLSTAAPGLFPQAARVLARDGYGWMEYVEAKPLADRAGAERFYRRHGALLAVLHVVRATDVHRENLVAHGDQPVLVDLETLFQPGLAPGGCGDPAADALAASVYRTALLPLVFVGELGVADLSGLAGGSGAAPSTVVQWIDAGTDRMRLARGAAPLPAAANRPVLHGEAVDPGEYGPATLAGFRAAYEVVRTHRDTLAGLFRDAADLSVRALTRATWMYGTLLDESTHPELLRDALDRDRALAVLHRGRLAQPLLAQLVRPELADLWAGDVPLFTASVGSGRLCDSSGAPLPLPLPHSGLAVALRTLDALGEVDRRDQEWTISATLAARAGGTAHPQAQPVSGRVDGVVAHPDELLVAACGIADQLVARGAADEQRVNWLGLEAADGRQWLVMPLGASLGSGYLGVALFLAQLAVLTGIGRYAEQARAATGDLPAFVAALAARPDLVAAIGCGGLHGLGGIAYGLARLGTLLDEPALTDAAAATVPLAAAAVTPAAEPGWAGGLAGCLAALTAVHAELDLAAAATAALRCADLLTEATVPSGADPAASPGEAGFADGLAGVGWSLATAGPRPEHRAAGRRIAALAVAGRPRPRTAGWCRGAAGVALASAGVPGSAGGPASAVEALTQAPVRRDLSLCHGELGVTEVLAAVAGADTATTTALRRRAGLVLNVLRRHGPLCGVPGAVSTPGLLTGLAGIGYGLLRLAEPRRVPSALLLRTAAERGSPHHPSK